MMDEDIVLVAPTCGAFAKRQFPSRRLIAILDEAQLDAFLASCRASSLTFCGTWRQLTVRVSRALAQWAIQKPERGCGFSLVTNVSPQMRPRRPLDSNRVYEIIDGFPAAEHNAAGRQIIDSNFVIGRLLDPSLPAPLGAVITGHGSEYCIRLGSRWFSTFNTAFLTDPIILPSFKLGDVIFLNCCSSLKLGDSCVPESYSLAALLFSLGSAVIGSFRNLHTSPHYAAIFAQALLQGNSLGEIVNRLNAESNRFERGVAFQLLGDPVHRLGPVNLRPSAGLLQSRPPQLPLPSSLKRALEDNLDLELLSAALTRWIPESSALAEVHANVEDLTEYAGSTDHAWHITGLGEEEVAQLSQFFEHQRHALQLALLTALAQSIQTTGWIQTRYVTFCRRLSPTTHTCARCGGVCNWTPYEPFASYLPAVHREECDHCGTTQERIGDGPQLTILTVQPEASSVAISIPTPPERSQGLLLFHRMPSFAPLPWPQEGGKVHIPYSALSFLGRLTLVAAVLSPNCLALQYHTFFVCPDLPHETVQ
ncbi:hypothetical protein [Sinorhizobium meliloti]|nr:hypothetical protein [Sinorhizobium meliloti]